jgi:hypothetical protein
MDPNDPQFNRLDENNKRFVNALFKQGGRDTDPELIKEAEAKRKEDDHKHDYSDSKNNDTCSTCGKTNPNDSYDKGKD